MTKNSSKRRERSRLRAAKWHADKNAVVAVRERMQLALSAFKQEPVPHSIPADRKTLYAHTIEGVVHKYLKFADRVDRSTLEEYIVEEILDREVRYLGDNYYEVFKVKWEGGEITWEPIEEFRHNEAVDRYLKKIRLNPDLNHELRFTLLEENQ